MWLYAIRSILKQKQFKSGQIVAKCYTSIRLRFFSLAKIKEKFYFRLRRRTGCGRWRYGCRGRFWGFRILEDSGFQRIPDSRGFRILEDSGFQRLRILEYSGFQSIPDSRGPDIKTRLLLTTPPTYRVLSHCPLQNPEMNYRNSVTVR